MAARTLRSPGGAEARCSAAANSTTLALAALALRVSGSSAARTMSVVSGMAAHHGRPCGAGAASAVRVCGC